MDNQPIQSPPPTPSNSSKTFLFILGAIALIAISGIGGYFLGAKQNQTANQQSISISPTPDFTTNDLENPSPTESLPEKTLINPTIPGKYTNEEIGYTVEFPKDWELYSSRNYGLMLYHPKCKGEDLVLPEKIIRCTYLSLPDYLSGTGWGYSAKRQVEEKILLKNNVSAQKETFYYDNYIEISWIFDVKIPKEHDAMVAFGYINDVYTPGSLETVNTIINSLNFRTDLVK